VLRSVRVVHETAQDDPALANARFGAIFLKKAWRIAAVMVPGRSG
jgi:hypothetical protein